MLWTDALSDKITLLWETQSATEIASTLGTEHQIYVTRNAVVGRLHRLGLTIENKKIVHQNGIRVSRMSDEEKTARRIERNRRSCEKYRAKLASRKPIDEVEFKRKQAARESIEHYVAASVEELSEHNVRGIAGLEDRHCRYPLNDDMSNPIFCGQRTFTEGASYCGFHQMRCHSPSTHTEQGAAK